MKARVWTESDLHEEALVRLQAEVEVLGGGQLSHLPGVDAAIIGGSRVDGAFLDRAGPKLKLVVRHGIGYDAVDVAAATQRGILVANTPDAPTESTAEHTVGLLLAVAKQIVKGDQVIRTNAPWSRPQLRGRELLEQRLGVVGYGRIGRRVVEICALGLKMPVLVYDPYLDQCITLPTGVIRVQDLPSLLSQADFVTLHTPLITATHHLIGEPELRLMKRGSYLINASRGAVVDETALIQALQDGHLAGAGLDVFDPEPPVPGNPLLRMDNVVVTPHIASNTGRGVWRMSQGVVDQVLQVLAGERPTYLLNPTAWPGRAGRS
jgi:D-3-phosphoglycerate dehydrogenase